MDRDTEFFFVPCELWTTNAERRMHHMERAERVRTVRWGTKLLAKAGGTCKAFDVPVKITVRARQKRGPLGDPATYTPVAKAIIDGCVDAGLLKDDSPKYVTSIEMLAPILAEKGQQPGMYIAIREA